MVSWKRRSSSSPMRDRPSYNEGQVAISGLRTELLETATLYGVLRAGADGSERVSADWIDWLTYNTRVDVWLSGAKTKDEMDRRLAEAERHSPQALAELADRAAVEDWRQRLEGLAESARAVEELGGEPLNEITSVNSPHGVALLGAVEDSLILLVYGDRHRQGTLCATSREIYELLLGARGEHVWQFMEPPLTPTLDRPVEIGQLGPTLTQSELLNLLVRTWIRTLSFYRRLSPEGAELDEEQRADARERLNAGAACLRQLAGNRATFNDLVAAKGSRNGVDLSRIVVVLRIMQRSLVLALSAYPTRRERAIENDQLAPEVLRLRDLWLAL